MFSRDDITRMAREAGIDAWWDSGNEHRETLQEHLEHFTGIVAAAERERIASQWDALHDKYMKDPLRRQMMLSYKLVANMIRGQG